MTISLSNTTVNEATRGIQIGTLSGGSNYTVYSSGHANYYVVNGNTLSLNANAFLDAESNSFIVNNLTDTNGRITASNYSQLQTNVVTIGYGSNLSIKDVSKIQCLLSNYLEINHKSVKGDSVILNTVNALLTCEGFDKDRL